MAVTSHTLGIRDNSGQSGQYKVKDTARSKSGAVRWSLNMTVKSHTLGIRDYRGQSGQYKVKNPARQQSGAVRWSAEDDSYTSDVRERPKRKRTAG